MSQSQRFDYLRTPTADGAAFVIGTSDETLKQRLQQKAGSATPEPADSDNDADAGGPIKRFTDRFSPLKLAVLEHIGLSGHEIADAIQMRVNELYRNEFPVLKPRFERKCEGCAAEFDSQPDDDRCPECAGTLREPDAAEKRAVEQLFTSVNREGQSLRDLAKTCEWDQWLTGVPIIVIRYSYHTQNGEIVQREPDELVKGDPKSIVPVVDENRRIGGYWWACPQCRHHEDYKPAESPGRCAECGLRRREVYFAEHTGGYSDQSADEFYFREEILTFPWAFPRLHGLDGLSTIHHIWLKQLIIDFQDSYAGAFYDPESERLPNQFIVLHTTNPDRWEDRLKEARENAKDDQYDSPVFANEYSPQDSTTPEVQVVDAMPDELLGQNESLKDTLKKDIRQAINISDVFDSDLSEAGGLNNEGLQIEVTDRSIASQQHDYVEGWLDTLAKRLGIDDWRIEFIPSTGPDAQELQDEIQAGQLADQAGLDARIEDGQVEVADGEFDMPEQSADPSGGLPGDDGPSAGGGGPLSAAGNDHSRHEYGPDADVSQKAADATDALFAAHKHVIWPDAVDQKAEEPFWDQDEAMPEFVQQMIREALRSGAISTISEELPTGTTRSDVRQFFEDQLSQPQGWSLRSLTQNYADRFDVDEDDALTAVRTQTASVLNEAREEGYRRQGDVDDREFKWIGPGNPDDGRTTELCIELKRATDPEFGGEPRTLDELQQLVREAKREYFPEFKGSDFLPHWNCRHTYVEHFD